MESNSFLYVLLGFWPGALFGLMLSWEIWKRKGGDTDE